MHELGLMTNTLKTAASALSGRMHLHERPVRLVLEVGELTGAVPELLLHAYDSLAAGTMFEGCEPEFIVVPGKVQCKACKEVFSAREHDFICPECGGTDLSYFSGKDIIIKEIVVENTT